VLPLPAQPGSSANPGVLPTSMALPSFCPPCWPWSRRAGSRRFNPRGVQLSSSGIRLFFLMVARPSTAWPRLRGLLPSAVAPGSHSAPKGYVAPPRAGLFNVWSRHHLGMQLLGRPGNWAFLRQLLFPVSVCPGHGGAQPLLLLKGCEPSQPVDISLKAAM